LKQRIDYQQENQAEEIEDEDEAEQEYENQKEDLSREHIEL
jgi:hypothetical protein